MKFLLNSAFKIFLLSLCIIGTMTSSTFAQELTLKELAEMADLIVIGSQQATSIDGLIATVEISPARILKGEPFVPKQTAVIVKLKIGQTQADTLLQALNGNLPQKKKLPLGLWFLKKQDEGEWASLPFMHESRREAIRGNFVAISDAPLADDFAYDPSAMVQFKLIKELGAEMERVWGKNNNPVEIRDDCLLMLARSISFGSLDGLTELSERFSQSETDRLRALALGWRIRGGDSSVLDDLENAKDLLKRQDAEIAGAIRSYRGIDSQFIQVLGKLTQSAFPATIRESAGKVLRVVHTKEAVPYLAAMLDSELVPLKYSGVMGLASFALRLPIVTPENTRTMNWLRPQSSTKPVPYIIPEQEGFRHMPALDVFEKDQITYTGYWKSWWTKYRELLKE